MTSPQTADSYRPAQNDDLVQRIGHVTRLLRDSMRELGLDKEIERAAEAIPDARDRLNYVVSMTEQAADRSMNAIDRAQPLQDSLNEHATALQQRWDAWFEAPCELAEARDLVSDTRAYLVMVPEHTQSTQKELLEILMAQDFQDLTGQVIKKMMEVIQEIETQLLQVLIDSVPAGEARDTLKRSVEREESLLNGPQIHKEAEDVVASQAQVDDLLDELGF